jgi:predicted metal-binding protein
MANIGIIRCEKNEERCPLTSCIKSLYDTSEGFSQYNDANLIGIFTCRCPGDNVLKLAKILKSKGADAIHFCTCTFANNKEGKWLMGDGFCEEIDNIVKKLSSEINIPCVKGTAHLPNDYQVELF